MIGLLCATVVPRGHRCAWTGSPSPILNQANRLQARRSGAIYRYFAVPQTVFERLIAAESKGAYFNHHVRDCFRYQRLA